jgi:subtilisin
MTRSFRSGRATASKRNVLLAAGILGLLVAAGAPAGAAGDPTLRAPQVYLPELGAVPVSLSAPAFTHPLPGGRTHTYYSWGVDAMNAPALWDLGHTGQGVKVAVIDTGIDVDHPYLAASITWGRSLCTYTTSYNDDYGHGTHVAGIVRQMAPDVSLYAVKVFNGAGSFCSTVGLDQALLVGAAGPDGALGTADDADIVTASIGQIVSTIGTAEAAAFPDPFTAAYASGVTFVAAAGNGAEGVVTVPGISEPAAYPSVVAVAALGSIAGLGHDFVAEYSSSGVTDGDDASIGLGEVEVATPGTDVLSMWNDGGWASNSGTSMATPHATGLLALLKSALPAASPDALRASLRCASEDWVLKGGDTRPGYDTSTGYGRPDASRILAGPCYAPQDPVAIVSDLVGTIIGSTDKVRTQAQVTVRATAADYVEVDALQLDNSIVIVSPDGKTLAVQGTGSVLAPVRVYFDGTSTTSQAVVSGSLVGAAVDGTWTVTPGNAGAILGRTSTFSIQGKTLTIDGWCCAGPIYDGPYLWNWHASGASTHVGGSLALPTSLDPAFSPLAYRFFTPA